jgi:hypothetical protein
MHPSEKCQILNHKKCTAKWWVHFFTSVPTFCGFFFENPQKLPRDVAGHFLWARGSSWFRLNHAAGLGLQGGLSFLGLLKEPSGAFVKTEADEITLVMHRVQDLLAARAKASLWASFRDWATAASKGGASKAHAWTKKCSEQGLRHY